MSSSLSRSFPISLLLAVLFGLVVAPSVPAAEGVDFSEVQRAAEEARYQDVVDLLTDLVASTELDEIDQVIAYSNRGIAYSLLNAFGLARQDLKRANELDPDHPLTLNHLGILAEHVEQDFDEAFTMYHRAAELGFPAGQVNIGNLYREGKGVSQDFGKAMSWYRKAADQGHGNAYSAIGEMYWEGLGVPKNGKLAIEWFRKGDAAGAISAAYYLGQAHEMGRGVRKDLRLAASFYRKDADLGDARAQNALGYLYRKGFGVEQDYEKAVAYYELSAEQGHVVAKNRLAWLLATCPDSRFCDGTKAVSLAEEAVAENDSPGYLDTLAAAYARVGRYDEAVTTMQRLMKSVATGSARYRNFERRLRTYEGREPYQL